MNRETRNIGKIWPARMRPEQLPQAMNDLKINQINFYERARAILELPLIYFISFSALSTASLMVGLKLSTKFSAMSTWIVFLLFVAAVPLWHRLKDIFRSGNKSGGDSLFVILVLLVSLAGGLLAASINRPDIDDSIYVPKAVFYIENPGSALDKTMNWVAGLPKTPSSGIFQHYEIMQAALAYKLNIHFLDLYHIVFPAIVGFLMCISMFLVVSLFDHRRWAPLLSVVFLLLIILSLGETHRTFGNISIARGFHAKYMFVAVGVPAWVYFSLQFLALRRRKTWVILTALGIAMGGASTTALVFLPFLSALVAASYIFNENQGFFRKDTLFLAGAYFSCLLPVVLLALNFRSYAKNNFAAGSFINNGFPTSFPDQLGLLINPDYPLTPFLFISSFAILLFFSPYRRFFLCWIALGFIIFLNPVVSEFIIKNFTSENIYWRLFYLLPFPIIIAIAYLSLLKSGLTFRAISFLAAGAAFYSAFWGPTSVLRAENKAFLASPGYKIHEPELSVVKEIIAAFPGGSMLAPLEISSNIVLLSSKYPQFHMREDHLGFFLLISGRQADYANRSKLFRYLYQHDPNHDEKEGKEILVKLVSSAESPELVVTYGNSSNKKEIENTLLDHGYVRAMEINSTYIVFHRMNSSGTMHAMNDWVPFN